MLEFRKKQVREGRNPAWVHGDQMRKMVEAYGWVFKLVAPIKRDMMQCVGCGAEHYGWQSQDHPALYHKLVPSDDASKSIPGASPSMKKCPMIEKGKERVEAQRARYASRRAQRPL
jgi:hypothetical protein